MEKRRTEATLSLMKKRVGKRADRKNFLDRAPLPGPGGRTAAEKAMRFTRATIYRIKKKLAAEITFCVCRKAPGPNVQINRKTACSCIRVDPSPSGVES